MIHLPQFTPSDDVLNAIRSLRADDDGMEPLEREAEIRELPTTPAIPRGAGNALASKYDFLTTGRYLRARA